MLGVLFADELRNVSPDMLPSVRMPLFTERLKLMGLFPASTSATVMGFAVENVRGLSSLVVCGGGTVRTGGSLTAVTVIVNVCAALVSTPPLAVPPLSLRV